MPATDTRRRILAAALASFLEDGIEATTVARICERSGVSNGALFHHFASKEAIAEALYVEAIASFQAGLWELLRRRPRSLRAAVRDAIAHHLTWVEQNADLARYVYLRGHLDWTSPGAAEVEALNERLAGAFREWMTPLLRSGELRVASMLIVTAIVTGPAHAIARRWLAGGLASRPTAYVKPLADAAWAGLGGAPAAPGGTLAAAPLQTRVRIELLDDAGSVIARSQHRDEMIPAPQLAGSGGRGGGGS